MEKEPSSIFDEQFLEYNLVRRRDLMPVALKVYVWLYMLQSILSLCSGVYRYSILPGVLFNPLVLVLGSLLYPLVRFGANLFILLEKKQAILFALIATGFSVLVQCILIVKMLSFGIGFSGILMDIGFILIEVPYVIMLLRIKKEWETTAVSGREIKSDHL